MVRSRDFPVGRKALRRGLPPVLAKIGAIRSDTSGSVAILAAVLFPIVIGGMGLGAEVGSWYFAQRKLQHAADVSAHAGAVRKRAGDATNGIVAAATYIATKSGFSPEEGRIEVNTPPVSGSRAGDGKSVEVVLSENQPPLFTSVFRDEPIVIRARAVVKLYAASQACVLALSPTASGAVTIAGSTVVTIDGCDVASNSRAEDSLQMNGGGQLKADCVYTVGKASISQNLDLNRCESVVENSPPIPDPYAHVPEPEVTGACRSGKLDSATLTPLDPHPSGVSSMRICGGLDIKGTAVFSPGLYIIDGGEFVANAGSVLSGSGVTFYLTNGASLQFNGGATINLAAPTEGPYSGLLFFGERDSTAKGNQVNGNAGSTFDGAIYIPASSVDYSGKASVSGCTQIIGKTVTFTGNSEVRANCRAAGTEDIATSHVIKFEE
ncbi:pilus assembly protein TadG-related protein [Microvirga massiliensis]|uniref:pilus assembly protein TadG-related protein n=1 Tax=Microvirga massiliensis TaxID=1033741 RepID=UPI00069C1C50|nr:pilus assembly protein TadG-related protein [Microvirga massiliensis]